MFRYDRLEELIRESGKTKVSLCKKIKKCPTYLRDAKKQNTDIKGETLEILAFELNTTPEYLTGEQEDIKSPTVKDDGVDNTDIEWLEAFKAAPEYKRQAVKDLLGLK